LKDKEFLKEMGKRIAARRAVLHYTQEDLADAADLSAQMISTAERGEKALRPENLVKISKALCVSADFLLTGEVSEKDTVLLSKKLEDLPKKYMPVVEGVIDLCAAIDEE
jgi:toxin-antitoxin system, antitoxin component, xre family